VATLSIGSALGLAVFFLDWFKERTGWNVPSMMATFYLFVICSVILAVLSYLKPHRHTAESEKLVWSSPLAALKSRVGSGGLDYRLVALLLFIVMIVLYVVFA
jgi:SSS family solute:Na+ symporter